MQGLGSKEVGGHAEGCCGIVFGTRQNWAAPRKGLNLSTLVLATEETSSVACWSLLRATCLRACLRRTIPDTSNRLGRTQMGAFLYYVRYIYDKYTYLL